MEKFKVTRDMIPENETVVVCGKDGTKVEVKKHLTYAEREDFVLQSASYIIVSDDDNRVMFRSYKNKLMDVGMIVKYYTNIDTSDVTSDEQWRDIFDWLVFNELYGDIYSEIQEDLHINLTMLETLLTSMTSVYNAQNSLKNAVMKNFGFLFTGEDLTESIGKTEELTNDLIQMMSAIKNVSSDKDSD